MAMIEDYPRLSQVTLGMRAELHGRFQELPEGLSELTFANIYLFRDTHNYRISRLADGLLVIVGEDEEPFFMLPFGLPDATLLEDMFRSHHSMRCISESQASILAAMGCRVREDRDNFDYLYLREDLARLTGRKLHKKKNLVNFFLRNNTCTAKPLLEEYTPDALQILENWRAAQNQAGDYAAAKEALEKSEELQLCGGIFYVDDEPVAYCLGEEIARGRTFVIHFEKALVRQQHKGLYQFINQSFSSILPEKYETVNREQDLGDLGLRHAKESYKPAGFVKKYRAAM